MTFDAFQSLPDDSRLWLMGLSKAADAASLGAELDALLGSWRHKGVAYHGAWALIEGRVLAICEPTMTSAPSGCAIDGMLRKVQGIAERLGLQLLSEDTVLLRKGGAFLAVPKADLGPRLEDGTLDAGALLVDLSLFTLGDLRAGKLEKPLPNTWIGRKFKLSATV